MHGVFTDIINEVYACNDLEACKQLVIDRVNKSDINSKDKMKIILTTNKQTDLVRLQTYITNSFLQFNGMKVI